MIKTGFGSVFLGNFEDWQITALTRQSTCRNAISYLLFWTHMLRISFILNFFFLISKFSRRKFIISFLIGEPLWDSSSNINRLSKTLRLCIVISTSLLSAEKYLLPACRQTTLFGLLQTFSLCAVFKEK